MAGNIFEDLPFWLMAIAGAGIGIESALTKAGAINNDANFLVAPKNKASPSEIPEDQSLANLGASLASNNVGLGDLTSINNTASSMAVMNGNDASIKLG